MDCLFCKIIHKEIPSKILYEDEKYLAILDLNQHPAGHTLIIPKKHLEDVTCLSKEELKEMFVLAHTIGQKLLTKLKVTGITYSFNYGSLQEIKHVHLHLLPEDLGKSPKNIDDIYTILKEE